MTRTTVAVVVNKTIFAPPQRVYDAWLIPQNASKWLFATPTGHMIRAETDPRVGGEYHFTDRRDGHDVDHTGKYVELLPGKRLIFTFKVPAQSSDETTVCVELKGEGKGTRLTLTHQGVAPEYAAPTAEGWSKMLQGLAKEATS
ncbi:MAG: SRPBCC family protein [Elusimicrobiota bacterium]|nr:SRPBCC family protein [Elusimicrobiota bacterium]